MQNKNNDLIVLKYSGIIQERSNRLLENSILYQLKLIKEKKNKIILVSMQAVKCEYKQDNVELMVKHLDKLNQKLGLSISLIDYSMDLYRILQKVTKKSKIKLFKNINAANLFLDPKTFKEGMRVLVYDKDEDNSAKLTKELSKFGYSVIRAKTLKEFQTRMNSDNDHDIIITHSALNMDFKGSVPSKNVLKLSKKLIVNLPTFMDTAVETLVSFTGLEAQKSAHGVKRFDTHLNMDIICAVMRFEGDLDGFFTLVFPKDIAIIAMESLLGEKVAEDDEESLKDGVGEFCNIITGSIKTVFSKKDIKVIFDLPKTYASLLETDGFIGHNSGIWIDMQLAGKPFYMFITK